MKEILIIRSVSFQQLDLNLPAIKKAYPDCQISLLTHEHGVKLAKKYKDIANIYVYPYKSGFKKGNKVPDLADKKFEAVIVPATNLSGAGFDNVLAYAATISSQEIVLCSVTSKLQPITRQKIKALRIRNSLFQCFAVLLSAVVFVPVLIVMNIGLRAIKCWKIKRGSQAED